MNAGKQNGPICRRPRPIIGESSEPILADLRLAKGCVLVSEMVMYFKIWACSNRTRMCDAPESIIIVMLGLGSLSLCCWDGSVELGPVIALNCIMDA